MATTGLQVNILPLLEVPVLDHVSIHLGHVTSVLIRSCEHDGANTVCAGLYLETTPSTLHTHTHTHTHTYTSPFPLAASHTGSVANTPAATDPGGFLHAGSPVFLQGTVCQESEGTH